MIAVRVDLGAAEPDDLTGTGDLPLRQVVDGADQVPAQGPRDLRGGRRAGPEVRAGHPVVPRPDPADGPAQRGGGIGHDVPGAGDLLRFAQQVALSWGVIIEPHPEDDVPLRELAVLDPPGADLDVVVLPVVQVVGHLPGPVIIGIVDAPLDLRVELRTRWGDPAQVGLLIMGQPDQHPGVQLVRGQAGQDAPPPHRPVITDLDPGPHRDRHRQRGGVPLELLQDLDAHVVPLAGLIFSTSITVKLARTVNAGACSSPVIRGTMGLPRRRKYRR